MLHQDNSRTMVPAAPKTPDDFPLVSRKITNALATRVEANLSGATRGSRILLTTATTTQVNVAQANRAKASLVPKGCPITPGTCPRGVQIAPEHWLPEPQQQKLHSSKQEGREDMSFGNDDSAVCALCQSSNPAVVGTMVALHRNEKSQPQQ